ncbi:ABC transporter permease [Micromonospora echinofusca]|uniref:Transport permease protein n=1 Tax=Micromonospora echinofusca TaxID=47858 RepID=A0ABS3VQW6_MICEH|nr:ABC transporter permease [Micromonospora echinofusca]MBO4206778.1 ABC transporter permease [Micromonospora echinofusca]
MSTDLRPAVASTAAAGTGQVVWRLTGHALRGMLRTPMSLFFALVFPLTFLVLVAAIVGDQPTPAGVPVAQFLVAPFAVFGVAEAVFCVLAIDIAVLREDGVLLRMRGTPVPARTVLTARIGAAVVVAVLAVALLSTVGVAAYGVDIVWRKTPALLLTLVTGAACFAALGLAVASATRTVLAAQTLTQGLLVPLAFVSDVFLVGAQLPTWLDVTGSVLPLKHFARALAETYDPQGGYGFSPGHLAVLAGWAVVGGLVARWRFGWAPRGASGGTTGPTVVEADPVAGRRHLGAPRPAGRPSGAALLTGQLGYALSGLRHDPLSIFFAVVFPVLLLVLFPAVFGGNGPDGLPLPQYLLPGLIAYALAVTGYVNLPESVAYARDQGILQRLRGTPLPLGWYLAGRIGAALLVSLLTTVLLVVVAVAFLDVRLDPGRLPAVLVAVLLGVACFAALGLAVASLLPSARSLTAVTLGTLLPLSFVSDVFPVGGDAPLPGWLATTGDLFPLGHLSAALLTATRPAVAGAGFAWAHLAVVAGWTVAALLVALRRPPGRD